jgi:hypothetical protein
MFLLSGYMYLIRKIVRYRKSMKFAKLKFRKGLVPAVLVTGSQKPRAGARNSRDPPLASKYATVDENDAKLAGH